MRHMLFATLVSLSIATGSVAAVPTACGTGAGIAAALQACIGQSVAIVFSVSSADPKRKALTGTVTAAAGDYVTIENRNSAPRTNRIIVPVSQILYVLYQY